MSDKVVICSAERFQFRQKFQASPKKQKTISEKNENKKYNKSVKKVKKENSRNFQKTTVRTFRRKPKSIALGPLKQAKKQPKNSQKRNSKEIPKDHRERR